MNTITMVVAVVICLLVCFAVWGSFKTLKSERCCDDDRNCCCGEKKTCSIRKDSNE